MASSENDNLVEELLKQINSTNTLIQSFTTDVKDHATSLVALETKLETLSENAKILSKIVRDDNGNKSILTRMALVENDLCDLFNNYKEFKLWVYKKVEENREMSEKHAHTLNKKIEKVNERIEKKEQTNNEKILAVLKVAPGIIALILIAIKMIWNIEAF